MKMMPPVLTPFVRSDAVGAIMAEAFLAPERELSIAEMARLTGVLPAVVHNEVTRLIDGAVLLDRREGRNRLVRVNTEHPLYSPMAEIIIATYGPVPVLRDLLESTQGVDAALIYGSWASRRSGGPGPAPRDIDVLAIGDLGLDDLLAVQQIARERLGVDVNIHRITADEWRHPEGNPFLETVQSRAVVWLFSSYRPARHQVVCVPDCVLSHLVNNAALQFGEGLAKFPQPGDDFGSIVLFLWRLGRPIQACEFVADAVYAARRIQETDEFVGEKQLTLERVLQGLPGAMESASPDEIREIKRYMRVTAEDLVGGFLN